MMEEGQCMEEGQMGGAMYDGEAAMCDGGHSPQSNSWEYKEQPRMPYEEEEQVEHKLGSNGVMHVDGPGYRHYI